jgi:hypothetical protein
MDQSNLIIRRDDGTEEIILRSTVDKIAFETVVGQQLVGELVGWSDGVYQIATSEAAIKVYSTMPMTTASSVVASETEDAAPVPSPTPESQDAEAVAETETEEDQVAALADAAATTDSEPNADEVEVQQPAEPVEKVEDSEPAIAATAIEEDQGDGAEDGDAVVESQDAAVSPNSDLRISVSVENSEENGPPVVFNVALSRPSESSVVLIYATIDGTAVNGEDYEANRGVLVIKPGEQEARIEAPIIDDSEREEQEHLKLFLTVDPTVATVEAREIVATIDDDDQG